MSERVWEVFRQEDEGDPMIHAGNVNAPTRSLRCTTPRSSTAVAASRTAVDRASATAITELDDPDL
jgi:hypothetical protein